MAKRTTAQRRAAAKASWAARKAKEAQQVVEVTAPPAVATGAIAPRVTFSATHEGNEFFLGVANNGSLHRVRAEPESLKRLALDILRIVP